MNVVSLFSGAGGLDLGFVQAGHTVIWANDLFEDAVKTYRMNLGDHIVQKNIYDIPSEEIPDTDIVIGGFPCQGFSVANTGRHEDDERNRLYLEMIRVIRDKSPKYFLAENVKGILSLGKGQVFQNILSDFRSLGYDVQYRLMNAADYGVPQKRFRVIIVGVRGDSRGGVVILPHPSGLRRMTCRELATIQSFPLDYQFVGGISSVCRQIGNAVPPKLAKAVASQFNHLIQE